jgi:DNA topoisomerase-2
MSKKVNNKLSIEEIYQKKTHHQHVLDIPDTYIGSPDLDIKEMWIYNSESGTMEKKEINMVPGLYKIFDEILVNSRDHKIRDKTCKNIKITTDKVTGRITVENDGTGIDVIMHKEHKIYVPELIFGNLLTSTNYEETGKIVGGKNGYGAKLANIFSTEFTIETLDSKRNKLYKQTFTDNMFTINEPVVETVPAKKKSYTKISFIPDYKRFSLKNLTNDMIGLFHKRVYDIAGCTNVTVTLNDVEIKLKSFEQYIKMFYKELPSDLIYEECGERWKVGAIFDSDAGFNHMSFTNGIWTYQGGNHVLHVLDQICSKLLDHIKSKNKTVNVKSSHIRDNLTLFIDCVIEDPSFSSQTKEFMTSKISTFGSKCEISDDFITRLSKTGIVEQVIKFAEFKEMSDLKKTDGKKITNLRGIDKLCDAEWAGGRKAKQCTLILTEGDSAKAFALSGLEVIGREKYGVFPLKGVPINAREATAAQLLKNKEFTNIKQIMGLKQNKKYNDVSQLRYGSILILTDQDVDGTHIKGLLINMFHTFWPSLLKIDGFIQSMATPIVKVYKKTDTKKTKPTIFHTITDYKNWVDITLKGDTSKWLIKYYKGLGTSTEKEAIACFNDFEDKIISYVWDIVEEPNQVELKIDNKKTSKKKSKKDDSDDESGVDEKKPVDDEDDEGDNNDITDMNSKSYNALILAFDKTKTDARKNWLYNYDKNDVIVKQSGNVTISDFINKDLIHFSSYNVLRAIPSLCDSFKPSQRKVLSGCFKRKIENHEIKVAQLGAYIAEHTEYHHGEKSLFGTIINMAQNFVDSNNINLLLPLGNFGYRRQGGNEAASERYIFTKLNKLTAYIFRSEDTFVLTHQYEDGVQIEPVNYAPIIPMVLVNGVKGIGTGFSTTIPSFNPMDIIKNIELMVNKKNPVLIHPWYNGFKGKITKTDTYRYQSTGVYEIIDENTVRITEIPIDQTTDKYKLFLEDAYVVDKKPTKKQFLVSAVDLGGNNSINFVLTFYGNCLQKIIKERTIEKTLKLTSSIAISNMYLHNSSGVVTKYEVIEDIFNEFYEYRLEIYKKRKAYMVRHIANQMNILKYKVQFIQDVLSGKIIINKQKKAAIIEKLEKLGYPKLATDIDAVEDDKTYRYVTDMQLFSLTQDMIDDLDNEYMLKKKEYDDYLNTPETTIWLRELDEFKDKYKKWLIDMEEENAITDIKKNKKPKGKKDKSESKGLSVKSSKSKNNK